MAKRFKILIVDDAPKNIQVVANLLGDTEYDISYATNGFRALELIEESKFDLVLLDVMMPEMDGFEVLRRVRSQSNVPVIMLTAKRQEDDIIKGLEMGASDYVVKPFNLDEIVARCTRLLATPSSVAA